MAFLERNAFVSPDEYFDEQTDLVEYSDIEADEYFILYLLIGEQYERAAKFSVYIDDIEKRRHGEALIHLAFMDDDCQTEYRAKFTMRGTELFDSSDTVVICKRTNEHYRVNEGYLKDVDDDDGYFELLVSEELRVPVHF